MNISLKQVAENTIQIVVNDANEHDVKVVVINISRNQHLKPMFDDEASDTLKPFICTVD